ncbi:MAG: AgmX/PglI C-terminal domain-containing protein, partial [Thiohalobacterales bacterium]
MVANTLQPTLPWLGPQAEDRRFRWILLQVLAIGFVIGGVIPAVKLPLPESEAAVDLPPRLVRIIPDQPVVQKPVAVPRGEPKNVPDTKSQPVKAKPVATPRQKAAQTGVLAMSDALSELRSIAPKTTTAGSGAAVRVAPKKAHKPSVLAADVNRGSVGIGAGVAYQSVLGATGLPDKGGGSGQDLSEAGRGLPLSRGAPARQSGMVRTEEEIQEILDRNKSAMYTIYNRALRQDATLQGKLVLKLTIAPSGRVIQCTIIDSELNAASLEKQLIRLIKGIDFGNKPGVPVVTTKVPIE